MVWDQQLQTVGVTFSCGKCGGSDYYIGSQVMSQGRTNTFTKTVQVAICKTCDIPMLKNATPDAIKRKAIGKVTILVGFFLLLFFVIIPVIVYAT